jgi:hypothetical protein
MQAMLQRLNRHHLRQPCSTCGEQVFFSTDLSSIPKPPTSTDVVRFTLKRAVSLLAPRLAKRFARSATASSLYLHGLHS